MRAKLVFVGAGRAGKTSTRKALLDIDFDAAEPSTRAAAVLEAVTALSWKELEKVSEEMHAPPSQVQANDGPTPSLVELIRNTPSADFVREPGEITCLFEAERRFCDRT
jgi:GTPase SAR1 family protein